MFPLPVCPLAGQCSLGQNACVGSTVSPFRRVRRCLHGRFSRTPSFLSPHLGLTTVWRTPTAASGPRYKRCASDIRAVYEIVIYGGIRTEVGPRGELFTTPWHASTLGLDAPILQPGSAQLFVAGAPHPRVGSRAGKTRASSSCEKRHLGRQDEENYVEVKRKA